MISSPARCCTISSRDAGSRAAVMCLRLARLFGNSPELWMRLQVAYDIKKAEQNKAVMK